MKHVPPGSLALRLFSTPTLVPRFGVDPAEQRRWYGRRVYPLSAESDDEGLLLCGMVVGPAAHGVTGPGVIFGAVTLAVL